ncbi:hypothetical protein H4R35_006113 [Dimargaris xerosporica]|nr:hypothetical protein H4R35_006113 [Dimargaris xerosporica]
MASTAAYGAFQCIRATYAAEYVLHVQLNRPKQLNALNKSLWTELTQCFRTIQYDSSVRAVVLSGQGRAFCAGLDLKGSASDLRITTSDVSRKAYRLRALILEIQAAMSSVQQCDKPVIAAVHGPCIGGGIDLITACDIRYCSEEAIFSVKEVDIGMAADIGTLQRLQKVVGSDSWVREVCLTARNFSSSEAAQYGLVSCVCADPQALLEQALGLATTIAAKSPIATMGTK